MFDSLTSVYQLKGIKSVLPNLNLHMQNAYIEEKYIGAIYAKDGGVRSAGVVLLERILREADPYSLASKYTSDLDIYFNEILSRLPDLEFLFNTPRTGLTFKDTFIKKKDTAPVCHEVLVPYRQNDPLSQLPMDTSWLFWQTISPLKVFYHNSHELNNKIYYDQLVFTKDIPSISIVGLDITALILQRVNYLRYCQETNTEPLRSYDYLHQYVINYFLLNDITDIWSINFYLKTLRAYYFDKTTLDFKSYVNTSTYGYIAASIQNAGMDIVKLLDRCQNGNVRPSSFLESLVLPMTSLKERFNYMDRQIFFPERGKQNAWIKFLLYKAYWELVVLCSVIAKDHPESRAVARRYLREVYLVSRTRLSSSIINSRLKKELMNEIGSIEDWTRTVLTIVN